jgi:sec-independent protein translocase protein TatB
VGSVGFSEIAVIAVLALFVLGPDRLPQAARAIGKAIAEFRRLTSGARADLEEALDATGMRDTLAEIRGTVDELNPRRIVADSLRAVEPSYGTQASSFVNDDVPQGSVSDVVPPPDADVAEMNAFVVSSVGDTAIGAPVVGGFHDVLVDADTTESVVMP